MRQIGAQCNAGPAAGDNCLLIPCPSPFFAAQL